VKLLKGKRLKPVGPRRVQRYPLNIAAMRVCNAPLVVCAGGLPCILSVASQCQFESPEKDLGKVANASVLAL
jgi:hypothetical protein